MTNSADMFLLAARNSLSFLEDDFSFSLIEFVGRPCQSGYMVTYRRTLPGAIEQFVCLSTAPARLELDLEFGRGWPPEYMTTISASELLEIEAPEQRLVLPTGVYNTFGDLNRMTQQYKTLADVLRHYGGRFFSNDETLWDALEQLRNARKQRCEYEEISRAADSAFKRKDWQDAIDLLTRLGDTRTKLQSARLDHAQQQRTVEQ